MLTHAKNATFAAATDLRDAAWLEDHAAHQQRRLHPRRKQYRRYYPSKHPMASWEMDDARAILPSLWNVGASD